MHRVFIILFAICLPAMSAVYEVQPYSSIENIARAHMRPDGPLVRYDTPVNDHHLLRLTALSIREQRSRDFLIFHRGSLRSLESLRVYNCQVQWVDFKTILPGGLKELHLRGCRIENISFIAKLIWLTNLSLTNNHIRDISALSNCGKLAWLDLRNNNIDNVSALRPLRKLAYVDLRNNPLGADSR